MPKDRWTTLVQQQYLESLIPAFVKAQDEKSVPKFVDDIEGEWKVKWPQDVQGAKHLNTWFYHYSRELMTAAGPTGFKRSKKKPFQSWQVYADLFFEQKIKVALNEGWKHPVTQAGESPKTLVNFKREFIAKLYNKDSKDEVIRRKVEERLEKMNSDVDHMTLSLPAYNFSIYPYLRKADYHKMKVNPMKPLKLPTFRILSKPS